MYNTVQHTKTCSVKHFGPTHKFLASLVSVPLHFIDNFVELLPTFYYSGRVLPKL